MTEKGESNVKVDARDQKKIQFQCSISYEVLCRRFLWSDVQSKIFYTVNPLLQFFFDINQWIRMICIQFQGNIIIFSFHHFFLSRPPSNQHQVEFVYFFFLFAVSEWIQQLFHIYDVLICVEIAFSHHEWWEMLNDSDDSAIEK